MTRTLSVVWPDPRPFADRDGAAIRLLAVSDLPDPALEYETNRAGIGPHHKEGAGDWIDRDRTARQQEAEKGGNQQA